MVIYGAISASGIYCKVNTILPHPQVKKVGKHSYDGTLLYDMSGRGPSDEGGIKFENFVYINSNQPITSEQYKSVIRQVLPAEDLMFLLPTIADVSLYGNVLCAFHWTFLLSTSSACSLHCEYPVIPRYARYFNVVILVHL
jgi:hypothetical protein